MSTLATGTAFVVSVACAGVMGFAIQRGGTCTVAAVDELVTHRRGFRLLGLLEASLWVLGGLLIAQTFGKLGRMPAGYAADAYTLAGGALLGIGAFVNRACVFGTLARLGSGEWAYAVSPVGFFVGCLSVGPLFAPTSRAALADPSLVLAASSWIALPLASLMAARIGHALYPALRPAIGSTRTCAGEAIAQRVWSPHVATAVIGITFLVLLLLAGAWAYTDVLAELARGMAGHLPARGALLVALFAGAVIGGATAGRFKPVPIDAAQLARCFLGGLLMGWGSLLIPGSNDGLILVGMPLLRPYAWLAFATMCASIAAALALSRTFASRACGAGAGPSPLIEAARDRDAGATTARVGVAPVPTGIRRSLRASRRAGVSQSSPACAREAAAAARGSTRAP